MAVEHTRFHISLDHQQVRHVSSHPILATLPGKIRSTIVSPLHSLPEGCCRTLPTSTRNKTSMISSVADTTHQCLSPRALTRSNKQRTHYPRPPRSNKQPAVHDLPLQTIDVLCPNNKCLSIVLCQTNWAVESLPIEFDGPYPTQQYNPLSWHYCISQAQFHFIPINSLDRCLCQTFQTMHC